MIHFVDISDQRVTVEGPHVDGSYKVTCKGKLVPHLAVRENLNGIGFSSTPEEAATYVLVEVDERMSWWVRRDELASTLALLANAMAVAAGFACWLGPRLDPFGAPPDYGPLRGPLDVVR